jgi:hypothetical protein
MEVERRGRGRPRRTARPQELRTVSSTPRLCLQYTYLDSTVSN